MATKHLLTASEHGESIAPDIQQIRENEAPFLQGMDKITFLYDQEAKHKVAVARWLELGLMALTLLVLALEARFIFAPVTRRIRQDMLVLEAQEKDMSQLFAASPIATLMVSSKNPAIMKANQKAADLIGLPDQTITKSSLRDYIDATHEMNVIFLENLTKHVVINDNEAVLLDTQQMVINVLISVREITFSGHEVIRARHHQHQRAQGSTATLSASAMA